MIVKFNVGDLVELRKPHPCGCKQWQILRTGMHFRLKCTGCGHMVMVPRVKFEKDLKKVISKTTQTLNMQEEEEKGNI
ncbi:MAG: DUF951 domain-containing protein [Eubacteriales bacterium]|nr:DUF951 domain-containing protein [Eubacteriales bacterium]